MPRPRRLIAVSILWLLFAPLLAGTGAVGLTHFFSFTVLGEVVVGTLGTVFAIGLLFLKPWARVGLLVLSWIGVAEGVLRPAYEALFTYSLFAESEGELRSAGLIALISWGIVAALVIVPNLVSALILGSRRVREACEPRRLPVRRVLPRAPALPRPAAHGRPGGNP